MSAFSDSLACLLAMEGVYSFHPEDRGGETCCGISRKAWPDWSGWSLVDELKGRHGGIEQLAANLTLTAAVHSFYRLNFWEGIKGDQIPGPIARELFEQAVNLGMVTAAKNLQRALNVLNRNGLVWMDIPVDGEIGPVTVDTVKACCRQGYEEALLESLNLLQGWHYFSLAERNRSQEAFYRGWLERVNFEV